MTTTLDVPTFFQTYKTAVFDKDVDTLQSLYGKGIVAFDAWMPWSHRDGSWSAMNADWLSSLGSETVVIDFEDVQIIQGSDVAAAHATVSFTAVSAEGDVVRSLQNRLTWVVKPEDGAWKVVHQHTSVPIDPDTLSGVLHR